MTSSAYLIRPKVHTSFLSPTLLQNLHYTTDIPIPSTKDIPPKHALVRIRAAAINPRDMMVIALDKDTYPVKMADGIAPCAGGAGEIEAVGEGSRWKKGERVVVHPSAWMDGEVPKLEALKAKGGEEVEGTLREFMVLIASALGATVIVTSSSDGKLEIVKKLGATHGINYRTNPSWEEEVLRLTNGKGVDHAIEIGGAQSVEKSVHATKQGGLISLVGILSEDRAVNLVPPVFCWWTGKEVADMWRLVRGVLGVDTAMIGKLLEVFQEHEIHPTIAKEFEWKDAKEAFEYSMGWSGVGKIVVKVGD
ncbi:MAG: hypothetical protein Q9226_003485 [Calogaya cf. arnoldii]